jgi:hypothetical protein
MDKKTTGIIATVATALLCGCPGLFGLCFGLVSAAASQIPGANIDVLGSSDPKSALTMGLITLCVSIIFIAIPVVVGVVTLRKKPEGEIPPPPVTPSEPMPPAI